MLYYYGIKVTYTENSHLEYIVPVETKERSYKIAVETAREKELFLRKEDHQFITWVVKIPKEEYDKIVAPSKRRVLFAEGMSPSKVLLITDAPQMDIMKYLYENAGKETPPDKYMLNLLEETEGFYVRILHDTELSDGDNDDIDVIGYDEVYDLNDFYDLRN